MKQLQLPIEVDYRPPLEALERLRQVRLRIQAAIEEDEKRKRPVPYRK